MSFERMHRWFSMRKPKGERKIYYPRRRHSDGDDNTKLEVHNGIAIIQLAESPSASRRVFPPPFDTSAQDKSTSNDRFSKSLSLPRKQESFHRRYSGHEDEKRAQEREVLEDHAGGYDLVRLDEVAAAAARLKVQDRNGNAPLSLHREEYLLKHGQRFGGWKSRWVVLDPQTISIYKNVRVRKCVHPSAVAGQRGTAFEVVTNKRIYVLAARTEASTVAWVELIRAAIAHSTQSLNGLPSQRQFSAKRSSSMGELHTQTGVSSSEFQPYAEAHASKHNSMILLPSSPQSEPVNSYPEKKVVPTYAMPARTARLSSSHLMEAREPAPPELPPRVHDLTLADDVSHGAMDSIRHALHEVDKNDVKGKTSSESRDHKDNSTAIDQLQSLLTTH